MNEFEAREKAFELTNPGVDLNDKSGKPQLIVECGRITVWCYIHGYVRKVISITRHHENEWTKLNGEWWVDHSEVDRGLVTLFAFVSIQRCFQVAMEALNEKLKEEEKSDD